MNTDTEEKVNYKLLDEYRQRDLNKCRINILSLGKKIDNMTEKIQLCKRINNEFSYNKNIESLERYQQQLINEKERFEKIELNLFDEQYINEIKDNRQKQNNNIIKKKIKLEKRRKEKQEDKHILELQTQKNRRLGKEKREQRYQLKRSYKYFMNVVTSIPTWIQGKLTHMPNNKGYIWRGVCLYGELPDDKSGTTVMIAPAKGGITYIHEWTDTTYKQYKKTTNRQQNNRQQNNRQQNNRQQNNRQQNNRQQNRKGKKYNKELVESYTRNKKYIPVF
jgi:hypothetical protein